MRRRVNIGSNPRSAGSWQIISISANSVLRLPKTWPHLARPFPKRGFAVPRLDANSDVWAHVCLLQAVAAIELIRTLIKVRTEPRSKSGHSTTTFFVDLCDLMAPQQYLTDEEIKQFIDDLDHDNNGNVDYWELEKKLDEVHKEIQPKAQPHNLQHGSRNDEARHEFLRHVIGTREDRIKRDDFAKCVKTWEIPSLPTSKIGRKRKRRTTTSIRCRCIGGRVRGGL